MNQIKYIQYVSSKAWVFSTDSFNKEIKNWRYGNKKKEHQKEIAQFLNELVCWYRKMLFYSQFYLIKFTLKRQFSGVFLNRL